MQTGQLKVGSLGGGGGGGGAGAATLCTFSLCNKHIKLATPLNKLTEDECKCYMPPQVSSVTIKSDILIIGSHLVYKYILKHQTSITTKNAHTKVTLAQFYGFSCYL